MVINQLIEKTFQGEGNEVGKLSTLIRFSGCNLRCPFCDSKQTWVTDNTNLHISGNNIKLLVTKINNLHTHNLILTGGEPFLNINNLLFWYLIKNTYKNKTIEIETNGTCISKIRTLEKYNVKIVISPKFDENCYISNTKFDESILYSFDYNNFIIKFIYYPEIEKRIKDFIRKANINRNKIYLVPLTPTLSDKNFQEIYKINFIATAKKAIEFGVNFSPRIQIDLFEGDHQEKL